jgi:hypothetical protein
MAFEVYRPRSERMAKMPMVTISSTSLVLNKHSREKLGTEQVELAFDRDTGTIRIRAAEDGMQSIKKTKIFSKGFLKYFNINKKGKYEAKFDENEKALFIKIE